MWQWMWMMWMWQWMWMWQYYWGQLPCYWGQLKPSSETDSQPTKADSHPTDGQHDPLCPHLWTESLIICIKVHSFCSSFCCHHVNIQQLFLLYIYKDRKIYTTVKSYGPTISLNHCLLTVLLFIIFFSSSVY